MYTADFFFICVRHLNPLKINNINIIKNIDGHHSIPYQKCMFNYGGRCLPIKSIRLII